MARARNIKPGFFRNEEVAECSPWARLCFIGLWTLADREGRLEDRPKRIKGELFAFDSIEVDGLLDELAAHDFILRYEPSDGGHRAIQIMTFNDHQTPHYSEKHSVIKAPPFPESSRNHQVINGAPLRDNSTKARAIKRGSQPPDSLNPDSLNPSLLNPSSSRAGTREAVSPSQRPPTKTNAKEPAWRTAERKRIAAVAPGAVEGGDSSDVFEPIDQTHATHEG